MICLPVILGYGKRSRSPYRDPLDAEVTQGVEGQHQSQASVTAVTRWRLGIDGSPGPPPVNFCNSVREGFPANPLNLYGQEPAESS